MTMHLAPAATSSRSIVQETCLSDRHCDLNSQSRFPNQDFSHCCNPEADFNIKRRVQRRNPDALLLSFNQDPSVYCFSKHTRHIAAVRRYNDGSLFLQQLSDQPSGMSNHPKQLPKKELGNTYTNQDYQRNEPGMLRWARR